MGDRLVGLTVVAGASAMLLLALLIGYINGAATP